MLQFDHVRMYVLVRVDKPAATVIAPPVAIARLTRNPCSQPDFGVFRVAL